MPAPKLTLRYNGGDEALWYISVQPNLGELNTSFITHGLFGMLIIRLALLTVMILWLGRELLTPEAKMRPKTNRFKRSLMCPG